MNPEIWNRLRAPFPADKVSWRVGSTNKDKTKGMALAYIDARDVMERLDDVCQPQRWQCRYPHANGKTVCEIGILVVCEDMPAEWVWKSDGAGDSDVEAEKGALSDAFKRAAVRWGIGRYLYDLSSPWVEIEAFGRSYKIKDSEHLKLRRLLEKDAKDHAPASAKPDPVDPAESESIKEFLVKSMDYCKSSFDMAQWATDNKPTIEAKLNARDIALVRTAWTARKHAFTEAEKDAA